jgi:hypothetical protein
MGLQDRAMSASKGIGREPVRPPAWTLLAPAKVPRLGRLSAVYHKTRAYLDLQDCADIFVQHRIQRYQSFRHEYNSS